MAPQLEARRLFHYSGAVNPGDFPSTPVSSAAGMRKLVGSFQGVAAAAGYPYIAESPTGVFGGEQFVHPTPRDVSQSTPSYPVNVDLLGLGYVTIVFDAAAPGNLRATVEIRP